MSKLNVRSARRILMSVSVAAFAVFGTTGCFYSTVAGFEYPAYNSAVVAAPVVYADPVYATPVVAAPMVVPAYRPLFHPYSPYRGGWGYGWPATSLSFSYNYVDGCW